MVSPQFLSTNAGTVSITGVLKLFCAMDTCESLVKPKAYFSEIRRTPFIRTLADLIGLALGVNIFLV